MSPTRSPSTGWCATGDIDLLVRGAPANARRGVAALRAFGAPIDAHGVSAADFEQPERVYQLGLPPRRIDLLTSITGSRSTTRGTRA